MSQVSELPIRPPIPFSRNPWLQRFSPVVQVQILASIYTDLEFHALLARQSQSTELFAEPFTLFAFGLRAPRPTARKLAALTAVLVEHVPSAAQIGWLDQTTIGVMAYQGQLPTLVEDLRGHLGEDVVIQPYHLPMDWPEYVQRYPDYACVSDELAQGNPVSASRPMRVPWWKRLVDTGLTGLGLLLLSPLFLLLSAYIYAVSPGPIFFTQERFGFAGRKFVMWKFRSMHPNVDTRAHQEHLAELIKNRAGAEQPMQKLDGKNTQIIPFGKVIRKASLDELAQLINVFNGSMSLVGPRPPIAYEVEEYLDWHWGRFNALPGMTGLWQVSGKNRLRFSQMSRLDIQYAQWCSPWLDLDIILRTPWVVLQLALEKTR